MKLGIVFEGGASRTFFSCGVFEALIDNNIKADIIAGSSAGIANAVSYASWQKDRSRKILRQYYHTKEYMHFSHLLNPKIRSIYNIPFVFDKIPNELIPFDYETFKNGGIKSVATVTNIDTGRTEYITLDGTDKQWRALVATCALPILFPPIEIDGNLYMDGGITDSVPVDYMLSQGCDKVIVVLTQEREYRKQKKDFTLTLSAHKFRHYPNFANALINRNDNYNKAREHIFSLEKQGKIFIILPEVMQGISRTENDPEKLDKIYQHGIDCTNKNIAKLQEYLRS